MGSQRGPTPTSHETTTLFTIDKCKENRADLTLHLEHVPALKTNECSTVTTIYRQCTSAADNEQLFQPMSCRLFPRNWPQTTFSVWRNCEQSDARCDLWPARRKQIYFIIEVTKVDQDITMVILASVSSKKWLIDRKNATQLSTRTLNFCFLHYRGT